MAAAKIGAEGRVDRRLLERFETLFSYAGPP